MTLSQWKATCTTDPGPVTSLFGSLRHRTIDRGHEIKFADVSDESHSGTVLV